MNNELTSLSGCTCRIIPLYRVELSNEGNIGVNIDHAVFNKRIMPRGRHNRKVMP